MCELLHLKKGNANYVHKTFYFLSQEILDQLRYIVIRDVQESSHVITIFPLEPNQFFLFEKGRSVTRISSVREERESAQLI